MSQTKIKSVKFTKTKRLSEVISDKLKEIELVLKLSGKIDLATKESLVNNFTNLINDIYEEKTENKKIILNTEKNSSRIRFLDSLGSKRFLIRQLSLAD